MGNVITNLKAKFGVDTSDFKKGLKDGESAVNDFKGAAGNSIDEFASMFGVNMSGVNSAIGTASKSLSFLKSAFVGTASGANILTVAAKVLKVALVSTGLGAIVVVLGSIAAYFMKSGRGADQFAKILAQVKSVVNNVIDRLAIFGKGLWELMTGKFKQGWETMRGAFKGIGDEIKEDWKAATALADAEDALEDREVALINSLSARKAKSAELRQQAKEELEDQKKKLVLLNEAEALTKSVYADQISLERERLRIMKAKLAIQSQDPTDEQRREIAEQEEKVNDLLRERADELRALLREKNKVIEANKEELAQFRSFSNIKMPQLMNQKVLDNLKRTMGELHHTYVKLGEETSALFQALSRVTIDATAAVNDGLVSMFSSLGEAFGNLGHGAESFQNFKVAILGTLADLSITVGNAAIASGVAVIGIKAALMSLNPALAIAGGIALVALGTAMKGKLASAASGLKTSAAAEAASNKKFGSNIEGVFDTRTAAQTVKVQLSGNFKVVGRDLVYVLDLESNRKNAVT